MHALLFDIFVEHRFVVTLAICYIVAHLNRGHALFMPFCLTCLLNIVLLLFLHFVILFHISNMIIRFVGNLSICHFL